MALALLRCLVAVPLLAAAQPVCANPFLTDDPDVADPSGWEVLAPAIEFSGKGDELDGALSFEVTHGIAPNLELSVAVPLAFATNDGVRSVAGGDLALSAKYRLIDNEAAGVQISFAPELTLPTAGKGLGAGKVAGFLSLWAQKDLGAWSLFGGGGYAINPGAGNNHYWTGGIALIRRVDERLTLGIEANRQGADTVGERAGTSLGAGLEWQLRAPFRLLASGGPTFPDGGGTASYHGYLALALDY